MLQLHTTLEPFGPACAILLTDDQIAELAEVARMGGQSCIGLSKTAREALAVEIGDEVTA